MKKICLTIALFLIYTTTFAQPPLNNILFDLYELPDVAFEAIATPAGFEDAYELRIKQPIDHNNPEKGYFYQRAFLTHQNKVFPTVLVTEGYERTSNGVNELTRLLNANQIIVEHRYFGESQPAGHSYDYLNLEQATADLHRIREIFGKLYDGQWISTGISKGGQTTLYYRYFYPDDVDVSVPYVAPINLELEDPRIYAFLDTIGSDVCRKNIFEVQKRLLKNRKKVLPLLKWYSKGADMHFEYLGLEEAFEYAVLEYPFSFWQMGGSCETIPDKSADLETTLQHFMNVVGLYLHSDAGVTQYGSHYYQAATEMGYYGFETEEFKGLLEKLPTDRNPHAAFLPHDMEVSFDGRQAKKAYDWLTTKAEKIVYINGAVDTWSATAIPETRGLDCLWFFMEGEDHGGARIRNMNEDQRKLLIKKLEEWLDMVIE